MLSTVLHGIVAVLLSRLPSPRELAIPARALRYEVEVEAMGGGLGTPGARARGRAPSSAERAVPGGAESAQNIHAADRGRGGDVTGPNRVIRMLPRDEGVLLFDSPLNNLMDAQTQRIRTAQDRATRERRRATPNPSDDVFLASGPGAHRERRPVSEIDGAAGAREAPQASVTGARPSLERMPGSSGEPALAAGGARAPSAARSSASDAAQGADPSPGRGILGGTGPRRSDAARVAHARPSVDQGPASTQAERRDPRVRDADDTELLARDMMQSWVEATARRGAREGAGRGGVGGGGTPGSGGGQHEGGRAQAYGPGDGRFPALDTSDARYRRWFLAQRRRVEDAVRFPRERALRMDQGVSLFAVVVRRDGTLAVAPRLVRSSGFDDLDRAALAAIEAATPFGPLPDDLAPELPELRVRLPVEFSNPMVR